MSAAPAIVVRGYRGDVASVPALLDALRDAAARAGAGAGDVQVVRADRVVGAHHLARAAELAAQAVEAGRARAQSRALEAVLYAAGERQIGKALRVLGVAPGAGLALAGVAFGDAAARALDALADALGWARDDAVLNAPPERARLIALGVDPTLVDATPRERWDALVLEHVAMSSLDRR